MHRQLQEYRQRSIFSVAAVLRDAPEQSYEIASLRRASQHAYVLARLLAVGSKPPNAITPPVSSDRGRSLQRGDSSSSSSGSSSRSNAHHTSPRRNTAERDAIKKSQALTARIGELGKQGLWQDVILALESAENNGQKLFVHNFSAAIAALTRSKQPERALQLLPLMQQRGIEPEVFAYTALIDACSKSGQWQRALNFLDEMRQQGITPNLKSYTAAIDACSQGGQWEKSLALLRDMQQQGLKPDIQTYTATIDACSGSGQWQQADDLLCAAQQQRIKVDVRTTIVQLPRARMVVTAVSS
jgi:pentatricopeptide repeat protein